MKRKLFTLLLIVACAALLTTAALAFDDPNEGSLARVPMGETLNVNNGTVSNNYGTVVTNNGTIGQNDGIAAAR